MRLQQEQAEVNRDKADAFFAEHKLNLDRLRIGNLNATEEREARKNLLEGKTNFENAIIETLGDTEPEQLLKKAIESRNLSMDQLQSINSVDTNYTIKEAQYTENGKPVNYTM